jgi:hypothetical protein
LVYSGRRRVRESQLQYCQTDACMHACMHEFIWSRHKHTHARTHACTTTHTTTHARAHGPDDRGAMARHLPFLRLPGQRATHPRRRAIFASQSHVLRRQTVERCAQISNKVRVRVRVIVRVFVSMKRHVTATLNSILSTLIF